MLNVLLASIIGAHHKVPLKLTWVTLTPFNQVLSLHSYHIMVNKKSTTPTNKEFDNKENIIEEMCASMDDLHRQRQTLEDSVLYIQQSQQTKIIY